MKKVNDLVAALYPQYGTPGSRDIDVTERRKAIDESAASIAEAFRALERTADANMAAAQAMRDDMYHWKQRAEAAEAKLTENGLCCIPTEEEKRLIAEGDFNPEELWGVGGVKSCPKCFGKQKPRPAPAANLAELVPDEMPTSHIYHGGNGAFNAGKESGWNACRAAMLRNIEEAQ